MAEKNLLHSTRGRGTNKTPTQNGVNKTPPPKESQVMSNIAATEVTVSTKESEDIKFPYVFGETLEQMVEVFGLEVVTAKALNGLTVAVQGHARGMIKSGKDAAAILEEMKTWKPGEPRVTVSAEDKARKVLEGLTPEQRAALLKEYKAAK